MKAASIRRRFRARNEGRPTAPRINGRPAPACDVLAGMLRKREIMLRPKPAEACDYTDLVSLRRDLDGRIASHRRACAACRAPNGPLDVFA